jgi:hypothetical protein
VPHLLMLFTPRTADASRRLAQCLCHVRHG